MFNKIVKHIEASAPYGVNEDYALNIYETVDKPSEKSIHFTKQAQPFAAIYTFFNDSVGKPVWTIELLKRIGQQNCENPAERHFDRLKANWLMKDSMELEEEALVEMLYTSFQVLGISHDNSISFQNEHLYPKVCTLFKSSLAKVRKIFPGPIQDSACENLTHGPYIFAQDLDAFLQEKKGLVRSIPQKETIAFDYKPFDLTKDSILYNDLSRDISALFAQAGKQKGSHIQIGVNKVQQSWDGYGVTFRNRAQRKIPV